MGNATHKVKSIKSFEPVKPVKSFEPVKPIYTTISSTYDHVKTMTSHSIILTIGSHFVNFDPNHKVIIEMTKIFNDESFVQINNYDLTPLLFELCNQTDRFGIYRHKYIKMLFWFYDNCANLKRVHRGQNIEDYCVQAYNLSIYGNPHRKQISTFEQLRLVVLNEIS
jgi:hypothetical protein